MAIGAVVMVLTEWMYRTSSRQSLPGPVDARSQLLKTGLLLSSQVTLLETMALWSAPIFIGAAMIGLWVHQERTHVAAYLMWAGIGAGWAMSVVAGRSKVRELKARRGRLEDVLEALG
jgi:hypothetical protein